MALETGTRVRVKLGAKTYSSYVMERLGREGEVRVLCEDLWSVRLDGDTNTSALYADELEVLA